MLPSALGSNHLHHLDPRPLASRAVRHGFLLLEPHGVRHFIAAALANRGTRSYPREQGEGEQKKMKEKSVWLRVGAQF